jgi:peptidyl-prolyl cis-trans isomerase A (cyclophilin A)
MRRPLFAPFRTAAAPLAALLALALAALPPSTAAAAAKKRPRPAVAKAKVEVVFETNKGKFVVALDDDKAPVSAANLLAYVQSGFYDGTVFHRVIDNFMIQGGGFDKDLKKKPTREAIKNEADNGLSNVRGTLAMARTNVVDSATSQFFINVKDNSQLDHSPASFGYAVIGEVVQGMNVVDAIRAVPVKCSSQSGEPCNEDLPVGMRDVPVEAVVITKAYKKPARKK